jgi:pentose-5-phosphate-3-epimerase
MEISISIEPYLHGSKSVLKEYIESIIKLSKKKKISVHFDYFENDKSLLKLVGEYANAIPIHIHSMVQNDNETLAEFAKYGFASVSVHAETVFSSLSPYMIIEKIKAFSKSGIVFDLPTNDIHRFNEEIKICDYATIMTVPCGGSGRPFDGRSLSKIPQIIKINPKIKITVDGGVNEETIKEVKSAKAKIAVMGSYAKKLYEAGKLKDILTLL